MVHTLVFTSLIVTLYLAQLTSLQLGRFEIVYKPLFTSLNVTLFVAQQTSPQLG